jgi:hypothetical protein
LNPWVHLEQFKKFCSHRYAAARAVAPGFKLGLYVLIQALRLKPDRTNPRRSHINGVVVRSKQDTVRTNRDSVRSKQDGDQTKD